MVWRMVGMVAAVWGDDTSPACLVRDARTGTIAWYPVMAQLAPPIEVGEWVYVIGGGHPDAPASRFPRAQVVGRAQRPSPPDAIALAARDAAATFRRDILPHIRGHNEHA